MLVRITHFLSLVLLSLGLANCTDSAEKNANAGAKRNNQNDSGKNSGDNKSTSRQENDISPDSPSKNSRRGSSGAVNCDLDFNSRLRDQINSSGQAQAPIFGSINFELVADAEMLLGLDGSNAEIGLDASIVSFSPGIARSTAENVINSYRDPLQLTLLSDSAWQDLKESDKNWEALDCIVLPVTRIVNDTYDYSFDPALPMMVSPEVDADRLADQLGGRIVIDNITSTLKQHFQPNNIARRGDYSGSAIIEARGSSVSVDYDFGTKAPEALATPVAGISYSLDFKNKDYSRIILRAFVADESKIDLELNN